jgi:hypothetical protein
LVGNLTQRQDNNLGITENYYPDVVNRLDHTTGPSPLQMHYDQMENISSRSDIGSNATWTYDPVHKHQVLTAGDNNHTYRYDSNGNASNRNVSVLPWPMVEGSARRKMPQSSLTHRNGVQVKDGWMGQQVMQNRCASPWFADGGSGRNGRKRRSWKRRSDPERCCRKLRGAMAFTRDC